MASSVRQYAAWCERSLARVVIAEGLRVGLLGVTQGPLTLTYRVRLLEPTPGNLRRLLGMGPAFAAAVQCAAVRVQQAPGAVLIELPLPAEAHRTPSAGELVAHSSGLAVAVGLDSMRQPQRVDLRQHGALFWIGPSRRGKTQSMKSALYCLARANGSRLRYAILSQKRSDWQAFEAAAGCMGLVSRPAEALLALRWFAALAADRAAAGSGGAAYVVVADDLLNLLASEPDIAEPLAEIASMGAGLGLHLLAGTQEGGSKRGTGGAGVENNATARILYRSSSAAAGARAAGQAAAGLEALSAARGDGLLLQDGEAVRVATAYADDREIELLPAASERQVAERSPWLRSVAPVVAATSSQPAATRGNQWQPAGGLALALNEERSAESALQPVAAVAAVVFPIERRPPTEAEAELIRQRAATGESLSSLCRLVYGHKDGKTLAWLKEALSVRSELAWLPEGATDAEALDLATEAGRATMLALLATRQINWQETVSELERRRLS